MLKWLAVLNFLLSFAVKIATYLAEKRWIEAGEQRAIIAGLNNVMANVEKAKGTVDRLRRDPDYAKRVRETYTRADE